MKDHDFMSHELKLPELTIRGMLLGLLITIVFTASNVYLGLKVGLTFSSAIPAAIISMAVLRMCKDSNILENNLVQTQASAAGTLSAVIFVIPGLLMIGYWQGFQFWQTLMICVCGGSLGVLFTIPLRRAMVVNTDLPYPEGRAAAEILKVGSATREGKGVTGMADILGGGLIAGLINLCSSGFGYLSGAVIKWVNVGAQSLVALPLGFSPALLGAGYLIGLASGLAILFGLIATWGGIVPYLMAHHTLPVGAALSDFAMDTWKSQARFMGAGTIGIAAIWTLFTLLKPIIDGIKMSISAVSNKDTQSENLHRMDTDMSVRSIGIVFFLVILGLAAVFTSFMSDSQLSGATVALYVFIGVVVSVGMGFFVAAACGYMAGLIGTSSSPISGIGILGIIVSSLVVLFLGNYVGMFSSPEGNLFSTAFAIFMTTVIVSIACISNDNLQDLKTGLLVGATPWKQQVALLIGCVAGAIAIAPVLNLLYEAYGFPGAMPRETMDPSQALAAPQATLMATIAKGIFSHNMDWSYILYGVIFGIVVIIIDVLIKKSSKNKYSLPPLAVGMGMYLPPTLQMPLVTGAVIAYFVNRYLKKRAALRSAGNEADDVETCNRRGILFASGLIVGESIMGVIIAGVIVLSVSSGGSEAPLLLVGKDYALGDAIGVIVYVLLILELIRRVLTAKYSK